MKVGIIGTGHVGAGLAELLVGAGYEVALANSRGPESLRDLVRRLGDHVQAATVSDTRDAAGIVVVSIPFGRYAELPPAGWDGRVVVDTCNYYPQRDGRIAELDRNALTSSELLAAHLRASRLVKAFNAINADRLRTQARPRGDASRLAIPIAGDDDAAKDEVERLIDAIGFDSVDAGPLHCGARFQPGTPAYNAPLSVAELQLALDDTDG